MHKRDLSILLTLFLLTLSTTGLALWRMVSLHQQVEKRNMAAIVRLAVPSSLAIGTHPDYKGASNSAYTLVEFMDYECPPCRETYHRLPALLDRFQGKVKLAVRQYPLDFHMNALPAACAAEAAREQGRFWPMHDALMAHDDLEESDVLHIAKQIGLDMPRFSRALQTTARQSVRADRRDAESLHLEGTPSFYLCCPDGRVLRLSNPDQIADLVR